MCMCHAIIFPPHTHTHTPHSLWTYSIHSPRIPIHVVPGSLWSSSLHALRFLDPGCGNGNSLLRSRRTKLKVDLPHSPWAHPDRHRWSASSDHTSSSQFSLVSTETENVCNSHDGHGSISRNCSSVYCHTLPDTALRHPHNALRSGRAGTICSIAGHHLLPRPTPQSS